MRESSVSSVVSFAVYGYLGYGVAWWGCVLVLFGYEEQWVGPPEAFYTLGSMSGIEQVAYLVGRYVLAFPAWPPQWVGEASFGLIPALASGALVGAAFGWWRERSA